MPQLVLSIEGVEIRRVNLNHKRTTLGRKPHNDIVLADLVVSGEHCAFNLEGLADVYVEDLHSTNGTYLNGQMVKRQKLRDHDVITVGRIHIEYLSASAPGEFGQTRPCRWRAPPQLPRWCPTRACRCSPGRPPAWRCRW